MWAETRVLPEKCIALEIQARKDLVALSLDDDDANPDSPASFAAVVKRSDKALASFFVLGVRATSPGGIVRELISRAARHGLVPSSHRFREQCVDAMLREDADDEELEKTGTNSWNSSAALDHSFVSSASTSARLAPRGDMGTASPWNRAINGRGFIVAVAKVPALTRRVVIVGRLKTPSLLGIDSCARVWVVALALSGADSGSEPPAKTGAATAHTVATLLNDDAFFSAALRAKDARDVRAAVLTFVEQKSGSGGANDGGRGGLHPQDAPAPPPDARQVPIFNASVVVRMAVRIRREGREVPAAPLRQRLDRRVQGRVLVFKDDQRDGVALLLHPRSRAGPGRGAPGRDERRDRAHRGFTRGGRR